MKEGTDDSKPTLGNQPFKSDNMVMIELDLRSQKRNQRFAHFFVNDQLQPVFISNLPQEVGVFV